MDYLDKGKQVRSTITLFVGYICVAAAIVIATLILVYEAYGFGIGKNNTVIQNGLIFVSSQPNPASIYFNNRISAYSTNARIILPSGAYNMELYRSGYRPWYRTIIVNGGTVEHFDYPFLIPTKLTTKDETNYQSAPGLLAQSPSRQYVLIQKPGSDSSFDLYNLNNPAKPQITTVNIPSNLIAKAQASESWKFVDWANDNKSVLLEHIFDGKNEYILFNVSNPSQSINLDSEFNINPVQLTLANKQNNLFYALDSNGQLSEYSIGNPTVPVEEHVLAYTTYGTNSVLYATDNDAPPGKVLVKLYNGSTTYLITSLPVSSIYLLDMTEYSGVPYVAVGSNADNKVLVYQDPVSQISANPGSLPGPVWVMHVPNPNYLSFSDSAQFVLTEGGPNFGVYDFQNQLGYVYSNPTMPIQSPQTSVSWMDGDRTAYVVNNKLVIADYDNKNIQTLVPASPNYLPVFDPSYDYVFTLTQEPNGQYEFTQTPLLTPADI
ncbi:MAG TPA: PEGA domain-containing protein [Candidatus Sulfotelmatobacter sp.]|nr:PEGA domain-containing protein [Candidatus Sulfotelmatobacter sp.]